MILFLPDSFNSPATRTTGQLSHFFKYFQKVKHLHKKKVRLLTWLLYCLKYSEDYAIDHFRPPPKRTMNKMTLSTSRRNRGDDLWRHSREPLKIPLLKKLLNKVRLIFDLKEVSGNDLWCHSWEPLKIPLLKKLLNKVRLIFDLEEENRDDLWCHSNEAVTSRYYCCFFTSKR